MIDKAPEGFTLCDDYDSIEEAVFNGGQFHGADLNPDELATSLNAMREMEDSVVFSNNEGNEEYTEILIRIPKKY